jgi:hypothetical protein
MAYRINSGAARVPGNAWVIGPAIADNDYATNGYTFGCLASQSGESVLALALERIFSPAACGACGTLLVKNDHRRSICCPHFRGFFPSFRLPAHERASHRQRIAKFATSSPRLTS